MLIKYTMILSLIIQKFDLYHVKCDFKRAFNIFTPPIKTEFPIISQIFLWNDFQYIGLSISFKMDKNFHILWK